VRCGDEVASGVSVILLPAAATVGRPVVRQFALRCFHVGDLGVVLGVREVDALDHHAQHVLLGAQLAGGCLQRGDLVLDRFHGL
jgi:hypothetical protein